MSVWICRLYDVVCQQNLKVYKLFSGKANTLTGNKNHWKSQETGGLQVVAAKVVSKLRKRKFTLTKFMFKFSAFSNNFVFSPKMNRISLKRISNC